MALKTRRWSHKPTHPRLKEKKALRAAHGKLAVAIKKLGIKKPGIKKIHDDFQSLKEMIIASDC